MMKTIIIAAALAVVLSGCASQPKTPDEQAAYHVRSAKSEFGNRQPTAAVMDIEQALNLPSGPDKVRAMFAEEPAVKAKFVEAVTARINEVAGTTSAKQCSDLLKHIVKARILSDTETLALTSSFERKVTEANQSGAIPFTIDSGVLDMLGMFGQDQLRIAFRRTLEAYSRPDYRDRDIAGVIAYLQTAGPAEREEFLAKLPSLNIRGSELFEISKIDSRFAERRRAELSLNAHLVVKNADRIFADDLTSSLAGVIRGITWMPDSQKGVLEVVVERVRNNERELPAATRTITYSHAQVDIFSAALLMPRGASYQFDLRTGGAEIEYGYVISAWLDGKRLSENVVRGKAGGEYRTCENARIVNVFGGVSSASFSANDDMRSACNGPQIVSMDELRRNVLSKISDEVLQIPDISKIHALN